MVGCERGSLHREMVPWLVFVVVLRDLYQSEYCISGKCRIEDGDLQKHNTCLLAQHGVVSSDNKCKVRIKVNRDIGRRYKNM